MLILAQKNCPIYPILGVTRVFLKTVTFKKIRRHVKLNVKLKTKCVINSLNAKSCRANQLTGFYMMATLAFNELKYGIYLKEAFRETSHHRVFCKASLLKSHFSCKGAAHLQITFPKKHLWKAASDLGQVFTHKTVADFD